MKRRLACALGLLGALIFIENPASEAYGKGDAAKPHVSVRLINWWDYISQDSLALAQKKGYRVEETTYRTNENVISRISDNKEHFDLVIASNVAIPALRDADIIERNQFKDALRGRRYYPFVLDGTADCLPYLWSSTVFFYDSRRIMEPPRSLSHLASLKQKGIKIGILDEPFEVVGRLIGDNADSCPKDVVSARFFSGMKQCRPLDALLGKGELQAKDFFSEVRPLLEGGNSAAYGWLGEGAPLLAKLPWLAAEPAAIHPVVGYDAVCILKNRKNPASLSQLRAFAKLLTSEESTKHNVLMTQYFSPYDDDIQGLSPAAKKLHDKVFERIKVTTPIVLTPPRAERHKEFNAWWRRLRYEE